jgi:membrane protein YqaA with SNARE-associated domain
VLFFERRVSENLEIALAVVRLVLGFVLFLGAIAIAGYAFRAPLEHFGKWFVDRLGTIGMAAGAFLADGCHFPLPPQFFLFTGIAGGTSSIVAFVSVSIGSILGGLAAFAVARRVARWRFVADRIASPRLLVERMMARWGLWGLALATLFPISYWVLCTLAGAMRLPWRAYAVLGLMRIPRLLLSYVVIVAAWHPS